MTASGPQGTHLEVDYYQEDGNSGQQVGAVWQVVPVKCLFQGTDFVASLHQQLEKRNDSTLKLRALRPRDGVWAECLPDDVFADVCGNEE